MEVYIRNPLAAVQSISTAKIAVSVVSWDGRISSARLDNAYTLSFFGSRVLSVDDLWFM